MNAGERNLYAKTIMNSHNFKHILKHFNVAGQTALNDVKYEIT